MKTLYQKYGGRKAGWVIMLCHDQKWRFFCKERHKGASIVFSLPFLSRKECLTELRRLFQDMA